jgi:hypothetical protein
VEKAFNKAGEDGSDHAEGEHVESDGEEDEGGCGAAAFGRMRGEGLVFSGGETNELWLGEQRVRRVGRLGLILGGVWHGWSRCGRLSASLREFDGRFVEISWIICRYLLAD